MPLVLFFDSKMKNRLLDLVVQVTFFGVFTVVNRLQKHWPYFNTFIDGDDICYNINMLYNY